MSLHTNFDFYYSRFLRNSSLIFYFTFIYSIDLSDGNSTGKEKKKKDDIIISKNQKSKAPPPVFVIADNMDANLLKFMNKNKNKTSPPKNILLEESHASQISSENYGNDDDDEGEEFVGEQHEKNNLGLSGSASQSFIDDDSDNDNLKMEKKKKEVEKTKNIQSQKIYQIGLNDNSIEEDDDYYFLFCRRLKYLKYLRMKKF